MKERYPNFPNYENFLKATNKSFPLMMLLVNSVLTKNREKCAGEQLISSTRRLLKYARTAKSHDIKLRRTMPQKKYEPTYFKRAIRLQQAEEYYRNCLECDERSFRACLYGSKNSKGDVQAFLL